MAGQQPFEQPFRKPFQQIQVSFEEPLDGAAGPNLAPAPDASPSDALAAPEELPSGNALPPLTRAQVEQIVAEYLGTHPAPPGN
ncbi:MAG TPA: hypothetical protein VHY20_10560, partial [Pirellulales bacterium]|nr:hypothetical protein [Pirellulales bacterium]